MSEVHPITVSSWFSRGWRVFRERPKPIIGGTAIYIAIGLGVAWVGSLASRDGTVPWIRDLYNFTVGPVMGVGYWFLCLKLVRGQEARSRDVFSAFPRFRAAWVTSLLVTLITLGGLILLVIPGIIWALKYGLSFFAVMDRRCSAREAIRFSGKITNGYKPKLFVLFLTVFLLTLPISPFALGLADFQIGGLSSFRLMTLGIVPLLVWVLVIGPVAGLASGVAYDDLASREAVMVGPISPRSRKLGKIVTYSGIVLLVVMVVLGGAAFHRKWKLVSNVGPWDMKFSHKLLMSLFAPPRTLTNKELARLAAESDIRELNLGYTTLRDEQLAELVGLQHLQVLNLGATQITDKGLEFVGHLRHLQTLDLANTRITGEGLEYLHDVEHLETLELNGSLIVDRNLIHLRNMKGLTKLTLYFTGISDAGLVHLRGLRNLRYIDLRSTKVTPSGVAQLEKELLRISGEVPLTILAD